MLDELSCPVMVTEFGAESMKNEEYLR